MADRLACEQYSFPESKDDLCWQAAPFRVLVLSDTMENETQGGKTASDKEPDRVRHIREALPAPHFLLVNAPVIPTRRW